MANQTIVWTALPNGIKTNPDSSKVVQISVFVSPRLENGTTLASFPDWLDWPARFAGVRASMRFSLVFESATAGTVSLPATIVSPLPISAEWTALFSGTTLVQSHQFDRYDDRIIHSYPVATVAAHVKNAYVQLATDPTTQTEFPTTTALLAQGTLWQQIARMDTNAVDQALNSLETSQFAVDPSQATDVPKSFRQVERFLKPRYTTRQALTIPAPDFHQIVSSLGEHPYVLRRLGLIVDLEVPYTDRFLSFSTVQVLPFWTSVDGSVTLVESRPKTSYAMTATTFQPVWGTSDIVDGMLDLSNQSLFHVEQVDPDGAAIKNIVLARHVLTSQVRGSDSTPQAYSVPALRSGGISVAKKGRAVALHQAFADHKGKNDNLTQAATLNGQHLVRGYSVEVWDNASSAWHPLNRRKASYEFPGMAALSQTYDHWISTGGAGAEDQSLYIQESLFRWMGWSLSVERGTRTIGESGQVTQPNKQLGNPTGLKITIDVPKTSTGDPASSLLPRLRFGKSYYVRMIARDLAGNSMTPPTDFSHAAGPLVYRRWEPVPSPTLLLRTAVNSDVAPGESVERLVIRGNWGASTVEQAQRHCFPPKTSELMAEQHRMFDVAAGLDTAVYPWLKTKADGGFTSLPSDPKAFDSRYLDADTPSFPDSGNAQSRLPYLPDPLARGATLRALQGNANDQVWQAWTLKKVDFGYEAGAQWPWLLPFRIVLFEQDPPAAPTFDATARVLSIGVPKSEVVRLRLSSYVNRTDLDLLGLWGEISNPSNALLSNVLDGLHWMLTPFRDITLVNAVKQPKLAVDIRQMVYTRKLGQTFATLRDTVTVHGKSTVKFNLLKQWTEFVDALNEPGPQEIPAEGEAFEVPLKASDEQVEFGRRDEWGDTKYRRVTYRTRATTRFRDYFGASDAGPFTIDGTPIVFDIASSARPAAPKVLYVIPTFGWSKTTQGSTIVSRRTGGGLRVYMERPWYSSGGGELLGVVLPGLMLAQPGVQEVANYLKPYVTQWAMDPIWVSGTTKNFLSAQDFPLAKESAEGLDLDELRNATVSVAGHSVGYDSDRKLWYSDLVIDPVNSDNSYMPFIRLALARYQPHSITDPESGIKVHLSRVVLTDFVQLTADRAASVTYQPGGVSVNLSVAGISYATGPAGTGPSHMDVTVQEWNPLIQTSEPVEDLGWHDVPNATYRLIAQAGESGYVWSRQFNLPGAQGSKAFRLLIREYEQHMITTPANAVLSQRLVYADAIEI